MKRFVAIISLLVCAAAAFLYMWYSSKPPARVDAGQEPKSRIAVHTETIKCNFYNDKQFRKSLSLAEDRKYSAVKIRGGIVPHHLLADNMISTFFKTLASQKPEIVVVIGPNHEGRGDKDLYTGKWDWETPFGILHADNSLVSYLIKEKSAGADMRLLEEEHSVSTLIPYIKYYMPDVSVAPILIKGTQKPDDAVELGRALEKALSGRRYVIIASTDFSHYLPESEANKMDEITLQAITRRNIEAIGQMGNDNIDSPPSAITLLSAMNSLGVRNIVILDHDNSATLADSGSDSTTSYFTMMFYE